MEPSNLVSLHFVPKTAFEHRRDRKHIVNVLLILFSGIYSLMFAGKKKTDITMQKLGNMSLSFEVLTCLPSVYSSALNYVINSKAREEFSFVFIKLQKFMSVWNTAVLLAYPLHHNIYPVDSFRNANMPDYI